MKSSTRILLNLVYFFLLCTWIPHIYCVTPTSITSTVKSSQRSLTNEGTNDSLWLHCTEDSKDEYDEERYSRQLYTLGNRAQKLVRSCNVIIDGGLSSGLVYECGKNVVLSGVGTITLVYDDNDNYGSYFMDDLGKMYDKYGASMTSIDDTCPGEIQVLKHYLQRLNPTCTIQIVPRSGITLESNMVYLCVDQSESIQTQMDVKCHDCNIPFISTETNSFYGRIYNDFGSNFTIYDADGETPKLHSLCAIQQYEHSSLKIESNDHLHDISLNDIVDLHHGDDCSYTLKVEKILSPTCFIAKDMSSNQLKDLVHLKQSLNKDITFIKKKIPFSLSFLPLNNKTNSPHENKIRERVLMTCFTVLHAFIVKYERVIESNDDVDVFKSMAHDRIQSFITKKNSNWIDAYIERFAMYSRYKFTPIQTMFGAIASQEVLKAATGLYIPIHQYFLHDVIDDFAAMLQNPFDQPHTTSSHEGLLGKKIIDKLNNQNIFVVGCGAIGCEILKNLSSFINHSKNKGRIIITDMDTIEKSNLSRQLLFSDKHVGNFKSTTAQDTLLQYNPSLCIESHTHKIAASEEHKPPFDDSFWGKKVHVVLNALDNMETRLYIDSKCIEHTIPLIDSGTLGSKGNVQVVVPHVTESYGSSTDPEDSNDNIPICTLKHFPYDISHTIQYAKDLFAGLFTKRPLQFIDYINESYHTMDKQQLAATFVQKYGIDETKDMVHELLDDSLFYSSIQQNKQKQQILKEHCVQWSIQLLYKLFYKSIYDLLIQHPPDSIDPDGDDNELFWNSNGRKLPKFITFQLPSPSNNQDLINQYIIQFIQTACKLRLELFITQDIEDWNKLLDDMLSYDNITNEILSYQTTFLSTLTQDHKEQDPKQIILQTLNQIELHSTQDKITPIEFEKDNDKNNHVAFITATSNLRAIIYNIKPASFQETRRIAGRIVPAMITTTALVSGLSCMEFIKFCSTNKQLNTFKNSFCNLALNFYAFTMPLPCEERYGLFHDQVYTLWDKITIKERSKHKNGITLRQFMKRIQKKVLTNHDTQHHAEEDSSWEISTISYGPYMIYANFLQDDHTLDQSMWDIVSDAVVSSSNDFDIQEEEIESTNDLTKEQHLQHIIIQNKHALDFTIVVENSMTEEEIELPTVRLIKYEDV